MRVVLICSAFVWVQALVYSKAEESAKLFNDILHELMAQEAQNGTSASGEDTLDFDNNQS